MSALERVIGARTFCAATIQELVGVGGIVATVSIYYFGRKQLSL